MRKRAPSRAADRPSVSVLMVLDESVAWRMAGWIIEAAAKAGPDARVYCAVLGTDGDEGRMLMPRTAASGGEILVRPSKSMPIGEALRAMRTLRAAGVEFRILPTR